jgi:hypothetical protein
VSKLAGQILAFRKNARDSAVLCGLWGSRLAGLG